MAASGRSLMHVFPALLLQRRISSQVCKRCAMLYSTISQQTATAADPLKWRLVSAVCLERYPIITRDMNDIETRYKKMMSEMELERSLKSDHELQMMKDEALKKRMQEGTDDLDEEAKEQSLLTALDLEDKWQAELGAFTPAPRITEADKKNDMTSIKRKLDRKLVLIVKQNFGKDHQWIFPAKIRHDGESMREAAQKALVSSCGENVKSVFLGNAPCGFYQYKLPKSEKDYYGSKIFIFKARYKSGDISLDDKSIKDYKWVTHDELSEYLHPSYHKKAREFLLEF